MRYWFGRIVKGSFSILIVVGFIMLLVYTFVDKNDIFKEDALYTKKTSNERIVYRYERWEAYGYLSYISYSDYLKKLVNSENLSPDMLPLVSDIGQTPEQDAEMVKTYVSSFADEYQKRGYQIVRLNAELNANQVVKGGEQRLFAYRNIPLIKRFFSYFSQLIQIDNIHYAHGQLKGSRGVSFTFFDPAYGGKKFSPALIGNGTQHRYLLYFDDQFPYLHQNLITIHLGVSYSVNQGVDVYQTLTQPQGSLKIKKVFYPTGFVQESADNIHSLTYSQGSLALGGEYAQQRFVDDYTLVTTYKQGFSKLGYSFLIGVTAVIIAYGVGLPIGVMMARKKGGLIDKLGTFYIVFIIAVPSLAYIFLFRTIGGIVGLPITFDMDEATVLSYMLPIISLSLPTIGSLMKWIRRFVVDQQHADYIKFARSTGIAERCIYTRYIFPNAFIPLSHDVPDSILGALTGAIITERVYAVPGAGKMLINAINAYDNGAIVGITMFYAVLTVLAVLLGDWLMSILDPRISFS